MAIYTNLCMEVPNLWQLQKAMRPNKATMDFYGIYGIYGVDCFL